MAVRLLCDWNNHKKGDIVEAGGMHETELIQYKLAKVVEYEMIYRIINLWDHCGPEQLWTLRNDKD